MIGVVRDSVADASRRIRGLLIASLILIGVVCDSVADASRRSRELQIKVCLVSGAVEYDSDESLALLQTYLEKNYPVKCSRAFRKTDTDIGGLENLETCDVMVLFTRRLKLEGEQLERIKKYCRSGKPIVAIRTASHAFQTWLEIDKEVLGADYKGHFKAGPLSDIQVQAKDHPILKGVNLKTTKGSLYKYIDLAKDTEVLLKGSLADKPGTSEPIAWTRTRDGGRLFYTSLGHQADFEDENFQRFLANAILWTTQKK
jgi:type 1 glutamine amidotransferase